MNIGSTLHLLQTHSLIWNSHLHCTPSSLAASRLPGSLEYLQLPHCLYILRMALLRQSWQQDCKSHKCFLPGLYLYHTGSMETGLCMPAIESNSWQLGANSETETLGQGWCLSLTATKTMGVFPHVTRKNNSTCVILKGLSATHLEKNSLWSGSKSNSNTKKWVIFSYLEKAAVQNSRQKASQLLWQTPVTSILQRQEDHKS